jgi:hypothetical protein
MRQQALEAAQAATAAAAAACASGAGGSPAFGAINATAAAAAAPTTEEEAAAPTAAAGTAAVPAANTVSVMSTISQALLPFIDEERIEALAVLDADTLWFLAELEASNHSEDVLLKWSLHPDIGRRLTGGQWLAELEMSEPLRKLYNQAKIPGFMSALNVMKMSP